MMMLRLKTLSLQCEEPRTYCQTTRDHNERKSLIRGRT